MMCERPALQPKLQGNRIRPCPALPGSWGIGTLPEWWGLHGNPDPEHIPCHRVVNAQGRLPRAYAFGGIEAQRCLLESEGVVFKNNQVVDLGVSQMILEKS